MDSGAILSPCHVYRYLLWRTWDRARAKLCWIMLNPSTADEEIDDATIRVCIGRARRLGFGGIEVVNLFALRATDPRKMLRHEHPISDPTELLRGTSSGLLRNNEAIMQATQDCAMVICAWGNLGQHLHRDQWLIGTMRVLHQPLHAIKINKDGSPAHPLRISYDEPLKVYG